MYITDQIEFTEGLLKTLEQLREANPTAPPIKIGALLEAHASRLREEAARQPDVATQLQGAANEALTKGKSALGKLFTAAGERLKS